ncbi:MAG: winged helix-turn-helix domain-containing protein, partial [Patescibacteria group bacterium]
PDDNEIVLSSVLACLYEATQQVLKKSAGSSLDKRDLLENYDAIILDYSLPKKNGLIVCKEIRSAGKTTPILFLSVNDDTSIKVEALTNGADDYVTKPFSLKEIDARLRAIARRSQTLTKSSLKIRDLVVDTEACLVTRGGKPLSFTRKEYSLIEYFAQHPHTVLSRALIMEHVWTGDRDPFSNTVEAHIRNVRKKLNAGFQPLMIINVPGRGYILDRPDPGMGKAST